MAFAYFYAAARLLSSSFIFVSPREQASGSKRESVSQQGERKMSFGGWEVYTVLGWIRGMKVKLLQDAICKRAHSECIKCQSPLGLSRRCFSFYCKQCTSTLMLFRRAFFVAVQPSRHAHLVTSPEDDGIAQLRPQPLKS